MAKDPTDLHPGEYHLKVERRKISLEAADSMGLFYGFLTLHQFAPIDESGRFYPDSTRTGIPALEIFDYPRFQ